MRRAWLILFLLAGCSAPAPVEATPPPVLIPLSQLGEGVFHIQDLSPDITGGPATFDNTKDERLWMVLVNCRGVNQNGVGVLPFSSLTSDILDKAQLREYDKLVPDCS
jgi:hypothetical protein